MGDEARSVISMGCRVAAWAIALLSPAVHASPPVEAPSALRTVPCSIQIPAAIARSVSCAELDVPYRGVNPHRTDLTIGIVTVHAKTSSPRTGPLLLIMGGNGVGSALLERQTALVRELSTDRDVILPDHRGAGLSRPAIACVGFKTAEDVTVASEAALRTCAAQLAAQGLDVNVFGPSEAAADLRDLRLALGLTRWDIYSVSYGTRIAQSLIKLDETGIRTLVLDGVTGWDSVTAAPNTRLDPIIEVLDGCAQDNACRESFPKLENSLAAVLSKLEMHPGSVAGKSVSAQSFMSGIQSALGDAQRRREIPLAISRAEAGDFTVWSSLLASVEDEGPAMGPALTFFGSVCREEYLLPDGGASSPAARRSLMSPIPADTPADWDVASLAPFCTLLGYRAADAALLAPRRSDVRTLILNGEIDVNTPTTWGARAATYLTRSRSLAFAGTPHWVMLRHPECVIALVRSFTARPDGPLDAACVAALPKLGWVTAPTTDFSWPAGVLDNTGIEKHGVAVDAVSYRGREALRVTHRSGENGGSFALLPKISFQDGIITVDVAGDVRPDAPEGARGFVGLAFRVASDASGGAPRYEAFYLRPLNGRAAGQERRNHSTQYISMPLHPWRELRERFPGRYESYVDLEAGAWTALKIEVRGTQAKLYVGEAGEPALVVNDLMRGISTGGIALWVDVGTVAHFANLKVQP